jgi:hypothetical protein
MSGLRLRFGKLRRILEERPGAVEWEVDVDAEGLAQAISYAGLTQELQPGDRVLLNTVAVALELGTGGFHLVVARVDPRAPADAFSGSEAGHLLKLRYTPLQCRVLSVEEEASPHRGAIVNFRGLEGTPVVCAELHSQMAAAALAAHAAAPSLSLVYVMTDSAALPAGLSRLAHALREQGVLVAVITTGQAFGGDYEAVNVYTGLIAARAVAGADVILVAQGPGNAGTGTEYGFSGLALLDALHAADALGGRPILVPRVSSADPRERHLGLSHHTATLARLARCPVEIPLPQLPDEQYAVVREQLAAVDQEGRHVLRILDAGPVRRALELFHPALTSMGRGLEEDPAYFAAAAASGLRAAEVAAPR